MSCVVSPFARRYCSAVSPVPCTAASAYIESGSSVCRNIRNALRFGCDAAEAGANWMSAVSETSPDTFFQTMWNASFAAHRSHPAEATVYTPLVASNETVPGGFTFPMSDWLSKMPSRAVSVRVLLPKSRCSAHQNQTRSNNQESSRSLQWKTLRNRPIHSTAFRISRASRSIQTENLSGRRHSPIPFSEDVIAGKIGESPVGL